MHFIYFYISFKGAFCNISEDLLTEMQYKIHDYSVQWCIKTFLNGPLFFITLE